METCLEPSKNRHFLGPSEHFFGIIALEDEFRASTCFKIAYQKTVIKFDFLGNNIGFYIFIFSRDKNGKVSKMSLVFA